MSTTVCDYWMFSLTNLSWCVLLAPLSSCPQEPEFSEVSASSADPAVFCGVGLALGLLGVATGTFLIIKGNQEVHDIEYIEEFHFNKVMMAWYNSTMDKWTGYTPYGLRLANSFNGDIYDHLARRAAMDILCVANADLLYGYLHNYTFEPYVRLRSVEPFNTRHSSMLVCSAYDFYPKPIRVTWLQNGQEVTSDVTSTEELANGDWTYQIHSHLEYTPTPGEKITYSSIPESERNKMVIGACGLLLGVVFIAAGLIYYRKKSTVQHELMATFRCFESGDTEVVVVIDGDEVI
ncbi:unnamed protein product [Coregonus sp. 'balchen']|nr:unnamed protein product [Coregonus sp. 'balchen']